MNTVKDIIPRTLDQLGIRKQYNANSTVYHWRKIVGEDIYEHTRAVSVSNGILLVVVDSPVWTHHLSMMKMDIINKINYFAGEKQISDIRFKAGYLKDYQNEENSTPDNENIGKIKKITLTDEENKAAEEKVAGIKNTALKKKIIKVLKKEIVLQKFKISQKWKKCATCTALCPPEDDFCTACGLEQKKKRHSNIRKILLDVPWLDYRSIREFIDCTREDYLFCKNELLELLAQEIRINPENNLRLFTYIMLRYLKKPDEITDDLISHTLHALRRYKGQRFLPPHSN